ncbi:Mth938-like domain-containing protein [Thauera phenolivorans]|uniref:Mth938-like domain-containing protein n=1 Tax=Thauera phenolivorans TaxID=1792543 RepID=UPI000839E3AF|nr:Mth938-like domain-containing protein [Thauera phenolivorans]
MKLHLDNNANTNIITGYGEDHVLINKVRHEGNLLVTAGEVVGGWASGGFDALSADDFEAVRALGVEIVLIGTGRRQRFPAPVLLRPLIDARIGFEAMDLAAACRTYNILVGEGRSVAAALLFDPPR